MTKDNIIFQLVNTEQNKEMLSNVPHQEYQDLSIIYRCLMKADEKTDEAVIVDNTLSEELGLNEEQLFELAAYNTRRILPPCVVSVNDVMREMYVRMGMSEEDVNMLIGDTPPEQCMWVITNEQKIYGAASLLYEDILGDLAQKLNADLYIMPSSVHEVIVVATDMAEPDELTELVREANLNEVRPEERLSDQVYRYDKDAGTLSYAAEMENVNLRRRMSR